MQKTAEDVQVGDVIIYESLGYDRREIKVTSVSKDIKNNRAGFDGVTVDGNESVWGYCSQIVKFVSHADINCLLCNSTENLLTETQRTQYRKDGFVGVDFYPHICTSCFETEKEIR
jgi:hypothetical protein